ncbi:MAG: hypothetical protein Q7U74_09435, partial [Saprospiraceae bacterium]|nr:hypothetical protein [Saprospiraceae bacterium]
PGAVLKRPLGETPRKKPSDSTGQRAPKKNGSALAVQKIEALEKRREKSPPSEREVLAARPLQKKRATAAPPGTG